MKPFEFCEHSLFLTGAARRRVRVRWYPLPEAHLQLASGGWHPFEPEFRLLAPENALPADMAEADRVKLQAKYAAFRMFRAELPGFMPELVEPFSCHQWPLMRLLKRSVPARDLVKANPVLAFAMANNSQFLRSDGVDSALLLANRYSRLKQREILGWLGFPDSEAMVRLLRKIPLTIVYPGLIRRLRRAVAMPEMLKLLAHLPALNAGVIFVGSYPELAGLVTPKLLHEIAEAPEELVVSPTADRLCELVAMNEELGSKEALRPFHSRRRVEESHRRLTTAHEAFLARQAELEARRQAEREARQQAELEAQQQAELRARRLAEYGEVRRAEAQAALQRREAARAKALVFPAPPIPGTQEILPLMSFDALRDESRMQLNCVGLNMTYARRVLKGELYVYRVLGPERHTLAIVKRGDSWQIGELERAHNGRYTPDAWCAVQNWLNINQVAL